MVFSTLALSAVSIYNLSHTTLSLQERLWGFYLFDVRRIPQEWWKRSFTQSLELGKKIRHARLSLPNKTDANPAAVARIRQM